MQSSATRSVSPHGIQWHFAPQHDIHLPKHDATRLMQKRCNHVLGQHPAIISNDFLEKLEQDSVSLVSFLTAMNQQAIFWRQLVLVREHHALILAENARYPELQYSSLPVAVCFDSQGVPWCPPLPESGLGDPYALSERLHEWWGSWQNAFPMLEGRGYGLRQADPATRQLCEHLDSYYNAAGVATALGTMVAIESALSTDCWERLRRASQRVCDRMGRPLPAESFLITSEAHSRLQARHALHLLDMRCHSGDLEEDEFFRAVKACLTHLAAFEQAQAARLRPELH